MAKDWAPQCNGVQNLSTAYWRLEAVSKHSCKLNVALHYCCLPVKALNSLLPSVFNMQSTNSGLHTLHGGTQSFAIERAWVNGRNVGITTQYSFSISVHAESIYNELDIHRTDTLCALSTVSSNCTDSTCSDIAGLHCSISYMLASCIR